MTAPRTCRHSCSAMGLKVVEWNARGVRLKQAQLAAVVEDLEGAFARYEAHRKPRTSKIQQISSDNTWLRTKEPDTDWLYAYHARTAPLDQPASTPTGVAA